MRSSECRESPDSLRIQASGTKCPGYGAPVDGLSKDRVTRSDLTGWDGAGQMRRSIANIMEVAAAVVEK
jgi:hypothetical protein